MFLFPVVLGTLTPHVYGIPKTVKQAVIMSKIDGEIFLKFIIYLFFIIKIIGSSGPLVDASSPLCLSLREDTFG